MKRSKKDKVYETQNIKNKKAEKQHIMNRHKQHFEELVKSKKQLVIDDLAIAVEKGKLATTE